jgi:hypothetical protein
MKAIDSNMTAGSRLVGDEDELEFMSKQAKYSTLFEFPLEKRSDTQDISLDKLPTTLYITNSELNTEIQSSELLNTLFATSSAASLSPAAVAEESAAAAAEGFVPWRVSSKKWAKGTEVEMGYLRLSSSKFSIFPSKVGSNQPMFSSLCLCVRVCVCVWVCLCAI